MSGHSMDNDVRLGFGFPWEILSLPSIGTAVVGFCYFKNINRYDDHQIFKFLAAWAILYWLLVSANDNIGFYFYQVMQNKYDPGIAMVYDISKNKKIKT